MLQEKGRVSLPVDVSSWREGLIRDCLVEIAIQVNQLDGFHGDPEDRLIAATALPGATRWSRPTGASRLAGPVEPVGCQDMN